MILQLADSVRRMYINPNYILTVEKVQHKVTKRYEYDVRILDRDTIHVAVTPENTAILSTLMFVDPD